MTDIEKNPVNLLEFSHQLNQMLNCFLLVFTFSGDGNNGTLSQAQSLQLEQAFALALLPLEVTVISEVKPFASLTN